MRIGSLNLERSVLCLQKSVLSWPILFKGNTAERHLYIWKILTSQSDPSPNILGKSTY